MASEPSYLPSSSDKPVSKMQYNYLGNSGIKVSELCLGALTFGKVDKNLGWLPTVSTEDSFALMDKFVEAGGNFIDTANMYGLGESERVVGKWMKERNNRDKIILATKLFFPLATDVGPNNAGYNRRYVRKCVESSLERLQTSYIDLIQVHAYDPGTPIRELMRTLNDLVREGKISYIGVSNWPAWAIQQAQCIARYENMTTLVSLQSQYNLLSRVPEWELFPVCKANNIAYLPWSPLKGGWLSGKFDRNSEKPEEGRVAWAESHAWQETAWTVLAKESTWKVIDAMKEISKELERPVVQIALRWLMQRPGVTSTIIGARKMSHLIDNLGTVEFSLSEDQMKKLNEASSVDIPYPYNLVPGFATQVGRSRNTRTDF